VKIANVLVSCLSIVNLAYAQVGAGTIMVFEVTPQEFAMAADSRITFANGPPNDDYCKIAALKSHFVVGVSGGAFYHPLTNDTNQNFLGWHRGSEARGREIHRA
jgi:hypothetical protein